MNKPNRKGTKSSNLPAKSPAPSPTKVSAAPPISELKASHLRTAMMIQSKLTQGPLPPAEDLQKYGEVMPGLDQRIVQWAEDEGKHRREMQKLELGFARDAMKLDVGTQRIGMWFLFAISMAFAGLMGYALYIKSEPGAIAAVVAAIAPLVGAFVVSRRLKQADDEKE